MRTPDQFGSPANSVGLKFLDMGVGGFLAGPQNPNRAWAAIAKSFLGKYKTSTLRNVDKRRVPTSSKPTCTTDISSRLKKWFIFITHATRCHSAKREILEKITCWPAPENPETINRKQLGDLKLTDKQEDMLVAFLRTLTDGYSAQEE
jgi:cytochrome c peroxidase